jgi:hypothetical protein
MYSNNFRHHSNLFPIVKRQEVMNYVPELILDSADYEDESYLFIKWKDYPVSKASWVLDKHINPLAIQGFDKRKDQDKPYKIPAALSKLL